MTWEIRSIVLRFWRRGEEWVIMVREIGLGSIIQSIVTGKSMCRENRRVCLEETEDKIEK